jgi:hypothetical protein
MNTIQGLQHQQTIIVAAVSPLLPLLQSISSNRDNSVAPPTVIPGPLAPSGAPPKLSKEPPNSVISISSDGSAIHSRKRGRSSSASHPMASSPLASGYARKKSRTGSSSSATPCSSSAIERKVPQAQTPRRPLQELYFRSPRLTFTPREPQNVPIPPTISQPGPPAKA